MVGVIVAGGDHVDKVEARRVNDALGHADVRFVGCGVLPGQRVRQIGIEQQMAAPPLHQKPALPQPPEAEIVVVVIGGAHIGEKRVVLEDRSNHAMPKSARTRWTPSTKAFSFLLAAQRAVWLRPQSGANDNRSAGANSRHLCTRAAMSSGVSM